MNLQRNGSQPSSAAAAAPGAAPEGALIVAAGLRGPSRPTAWRDGDRDEAMSSAPGAYC